MTDTSTNDGGLADAVAIKNYLGPYEAWNFGLGKAYAFPAYRGDDVRFLSALAEHPEPQKPHSLLDGVASDGHGMWLPTVWGKEDDVALRFWPIVVENRSDDGIAPDSLALNLTEAMLSDPIGEARFRMAFPVEEEAMHRHARRMTADPVWKPDTGVGTGDGPNRTLNVLGVIDDGIPFAHRNFRAADGKRTRLEFCWLQSAHKKEGQDHPSVLFGREFTRETIEQLIAKHPEDEDALYAEAGASDQQFGSGAAINRLATHGSNVMDIAAGSNPDKGHVPPEETRLIAVQLPNTYGWDTSSFGKDMYMLSAVHYILERAERIAEGYGVKDIRVTINISYGFSAGRHDGEGELEAAMDEIVAKRRQLGRPTAIVIPSGNTFQDRLHAEITSDHLGSGTFEFSWKTQPNDLSSNYLEIWFPDQLDPGDFDIEVKGPFGKISAGMALKPDPSYQHGDPRNFKSIQLDPPNQGDAIGQISLDNHRKSGRWRVLIALAPSEPHDPGLPAAPAGEWKIVLSRGDVAPRDHEPIYLWVQRDIDLEPFLTGSRQSYLHDDDYRLVSEKGAEEESDQPDSNVKRFGSLNGMATGATTLVVAGSRPVIGSRFEKGELMASSFSSAGKTASGPAVGSVDCTARADRSNIVPGIVGAGTRSGSYSSVQGTSVAAPLVARRLSEAFSRCSDQEIKTAEKDNYLPIVQSIALSDQSVEGRTRLGEFLVI
ncbi:S8 family serine peptidase [Labrenzia sp. DG1229]|uniref:S8 family serine peptidase n=1 Tax=Labrenzia sp. DG1229 TaxID=681847 RepID=UPI00048B3DE7|nr:S8 family serine peptidase [Labrenzia sp. DG1229]